MNTETASKDNPMEGSFAASTSNRQTESTKELLTAGPQRWEAIKERGYRLRSQSCIWARLHLNGCSESTDRVLYNHFFALDKPSDSHLFEWTGKDLASSLLNQADASSLQMDDPPPRPIPPSLMKYYFSIPSLLSPGDNLPAADIAISIDTLIIRECLYDTYLICPGVSVLHPNDFSSLVVQVMIPSTFDDAYGRATYRNGAEAIEAWENETWLYARTLSSLQGTTVPRCFGVAHGLIEPHMAKPDSLYFMLLENLGDAVCGSKEELRSLSHETKLAIEALYKDLHGARILHNDLEPSYIRRLADGSLCLSNFEADEVVVPAGERGDASLAREMKEVMEILGSESA
ncbi:hypothetical protein IAR50_001633 [Cryptococcus sp. DSM 104548]